MGAANRPGACALRALRRRRLWPMFFEIFASCFLAGDAVLDSATLVASCHRDRGSTRARYVIPRNPVGNIDQQPRANEKCRVQEHGFNPRYYGL